MVIKNKYLNLDQIYDSGQVFKWYKEDGYYVVIHQNKAVKCVQREDGIDIDSEDEEFLHYFDLNRSYQDIISFYKGRDAFLDKAVNFGKGIRILNQDHFETLLCFIISSNNNIKRITNSVDMLSRKYGKKLVAVDGKEYHSFPTADDLKDVSIKEYRKLGLGYRDKYLYSAVEAVLNGFDLDALEELETDDLRKKLMSLKGVGEKVANCILLFSYGRTECFPIDTWVKKILLEDYGVKDNYKEFIERKFPVDAGIVQQYLFYYKRFM